ncbi:MAG: hypothetical protein R3E32_27175 [Chitinophagales bacterium]
MKSKTVNCFLLACCLLFFFSFNCSAQGPTTITDNTAGTATKDGTINGGEYVGSSTGINSGFGNVIGSSSTLYFDSDDTGNLSVGLSSGGGDLNDAVVIYIDVDGTGSGFNTTSGFNDVADALRAAISGQGTTSGTSDLTFAGGFNADYAIAFNATFAGLWQLVNGGSHTFIVDLGITPSGNTAAGAWEMDGFTMANIGLSPGQSFNYVATYLNSSNAFRSDEFHGVAQSTANTGNIGSNPISLAAGDFNTFHSFDQTPNITTITDNAATIATNDGTVNSGEYAGFSNACGDGFGGILGATTLHFDSDDLGNLAMALDGGSALTDPNTIVIYMDVDGTASGITSTSDLTDAADGGRAAISGNGTGGGSSDLTFPSDFNPDYAIVIQDGSQSLFQLSPTNNLTFVATLTVNSGGTTREFSDISMADLGLVAGDSFTFIATLLNKTNAFCSDEFHGVTYCPVAVVQSQILE